MEATSYSYKELHEAVYKAQTAPIKIYYDKFLIQIFS